MYFENIIHTSIIHNAIYKAGIWGNPEANTLFKGPSQKGPLKESIFFKDIENKVFRFILYIFVKRKHLVSQ